MPRLNILNKANSQNVFAYFDLMGNLNVKIEGIIQDLSKFKGFKQESDQKDLQIIKNYLIKSQKKLDKLRTRLHKSQSWFRRK